MNSYRNPVPAWSVVIATAIVIAAALLFMTLDNYTKALIAEADAQAAQAVALVVQQHGIECGEVPAGVVVAEAVR